MTPRVSETIRQDHVAIRAIYQRIVASTNRDEQIRFQNLFVWELARHTVGEELVVFPAFEKHVRHLGLGLAKKDREQHQEVLPLCQKTLNFDWQGKSNDICR